MSKAASGRLGHERGLAQTGLARDEEDLTPFATGHPLDGVGDGLDLGVASDDAHGGPHGQTTGRGIEVAVIGSPSGSQATSTVSTGSGKPFRVSSPRDRYS